MLRSFFSYFPDDEWFGYEHKFLRFIEELSIRSDIRYIYIYISVAFILSGNTCARKYIPGEICVGTFSQRRLFGIFSHSMWFALSDLYSVKFRALTWLRCPSQYSSCISRLHDSTTSSKRRIDNIRILKLINAILHVFKLWTW